MADGETAPFPPAWDEIAAHPAFAAAVRHLAAGMLLLCDADPALCAVFKDAGRYMAAMFAAYLHGKGGLSLALLKQLCAASGFLSPGRAEAIIEVLIHFDFVRASDGGAYLPTARFMAAWCLHLKVALEAASLIEPALVPLAANLDRGDCFSGFLGIQAARLNALAQRPDPLPVLRRSFLDPYAGSQLLWTLVAAGATAPEAPATTISLSGISRRFDVTRLHVRRVLKHADGEGLLAYRGRGQLAFTPRGVRDVRLFYAAQLSELIVSGREGLAPPLADSAGKFVPLS